MPLSASSLFWYSQFAVNTLLAYVLVMQSSILSWSEAPVMTVIETTSAPVTDLHFPVVTVCPVGYVPPKRFSLMEHILNRYNHAVKH